MVLINYTRVKGLSPYGPGCAVTRFMGFPGGSVVKNLLTIAEDVGLSPRLGSSLEKEIATHSSILVWKISWTEEPSGLQPTGSQRVGHD